MFYQISLYQYFQALINKLFLKSPSDRSPIGTHDSNETSIFMQEFGRVPSFPTRSSVVFRRGPERWFCWRMERV